MSAAVYLTTASWLLLGSVAAQQASKFANQNTPHWYYSSVKAYCFKMKSTYAGIVVPPKSVNAELNQKH